MHKNQITALKKYDSLIGKKFNSLEILKLDKVNKSGQYYILCKCNCGKIKSFRADRVLNGISKTCGCQNKNYKYGDHHNLSHKYANLYSMWNTMRHRCKNPQNNKFKDYGKRGISYCSEWDDFPTFLSWSVSNGYKKGLSLDRIDNNGNYEPKNCRWVTNKEQQRNTRKSHFVVYKNTKKTIAEWCELLELPYKTILYRILHNWGIEKSFETPIKRRK